MKTLHPIIEAYRNRPLVQRYSNTPTITNWKIPYVQIVASGTSITTEDGIDITTEDGQVLTTE